MNSFSNSIIGSSLLVLFAAGQSLGGLSGGHHDQNRDRDDGDDDGQQHLPHLRPKLHHACGGGHKEQREDTGEKHAHLFYILQLDQPEVQGQQQQHKPVHTGRNRQRQHSMTYFPQKAKREDTRKLKQIIRKKIPLV